MSIYVFVSQSDKNAHQALNSEKWAFSDKKKPSHGNTIGVGDRFLIYSQESKKIFGGGVLEGKPSFGNSITDEIWDGIWHDPISLHVQKHSNHGIDGKHYFENVPSKSRSTKQWNERCVLNNNVAPSDFDDDDFKYIINSL